MSIQRFAAALSCAALLSLSGAASADHTWNNYHWARTANPLPLRVVDSVSADWDGELATALSRWSDSSVLDLAVVAADDAGKTRKRCAMVPGQMRVCNAAYGYNGWLGLATIGLDANGHIDQGSAKMNDSYSSYWARPGEKNHVMCQEIGHVFGLGHTSEDGSSQQTCMDYSSDINSQFPNAHDYEMLAQMYQHLDAYNSYDTGTSGGGGCKGRGCRGAAGEVPPMGVRVHQGRHEEIWAASRPDGGLWIHHVRLAPEGAR